MTSEPAKSNDKTKPIRLCVIINPSFGLTLPYGKLWSHLISQGFECTGVAGPGPEHEVVRKIGVKTHAVPIERYPCPLKDLVSLVRIWWFLLWHRFDIVHISTPKASFLGALAARLSGHRRLVYMVRGRCYELMTGWRRKMMRVCEWIACGLSAVVLPISRELARVLVADRLCSPKKIRIIGSGSSKGIDLERFTRTPERVRVGRQLRESLGITDSDLAILFVGWLRKDKGVDDLIPAFQQLAGEYPNVHLILLGDYEPSDPLKPETVDGITHHPRIHHIRWQEEPASVYMAADIVAFPSHREGFGNVPLEASAMEVPSVVSDIMGCRESCQDGVTGILVPCGRPEGFHDGLKKLIDDPELRRRMGQNGRRRVEAEFRQEIIWEGLVNLYRELVGARM